MNWIFKEMPSAVAIFDYLTDGLSAKSKNQILEDLIEPNSQNVFIFIQPFLIFSCFYGWK